jgi:CopG family nickel-responsive transcriptional regulator
MSDLVRFGVAMERALLDEFDRRIAAKGYENRSEALRDLVRADLVRAARDAGAYVAATLTLVVDPRARDVALRLAEIEGQPGSGVVSSLRVPLDEGRAMSVLALRGRAHELASLAGQLGGSKGVLACELTLASVVSEGAHEARQARAGAPGGAR